MENIVVIVIALIGSTGLWNLLQTAVSKKHDKQEEIIQSIKELKEDMNLTKTANQRLLRDRLVQAYKYHARNGFCSNEDKELWEEMYQAYHSLGKNGVMDKKREILLSMREE